ncbi:MAG: type II secretion system protein, partial [Chloroflexi bacterium]|nr:type II secretion system protein [Chloroflexota bacterium]
MRNEKGFSLVEVLVALALLGIIGAAFLGGIATASKAILIADKRTTAESLARSQMEYVKEQPYITADNYDPGVPGSGEVTYLGITESAYTIWSVNRAGNIVEDIKGVPWDTQNYQPTTTDVGLQRIKLIIKHQDEEVITLE